MLRILNSKSKYLNSKQIQNSNSQNTKQMLLADSRFCFENLDFGYLRLFWIYGLVLWILM